MRSLKAQWIALVTALAVLLPGNVFGRTQYFCRMMDRVVSTCCCGERDHAREDASLGPQVRATDCCQKISKGAPSVPFRAVGDASPIPSAAPAATLPAPLYVVPKAVATLTAPAQARAPPGLGPPLFIVHCSLLT